MFEPTAPALLNTIFVCVVPMVLHPAEYELYIIFIFFVVIDGFRIRCCVGCGRFGPERRLLTVFIERRRSCRQENTFARIWLWLKQKHYMFIW